jgi:hypothetical protein
MYEILEISLGDTNRLYRYKLDDVYGAKFSLKGFDYPWLLTSRQWTGAEKVLDVGAAYSPLPVHIQQMFGCEVWVADDFGTTTDESFWTRNKSASEYVASHPEIKFVLERLGNSATSSLPAGYFDIIYSLSVLEHIPQKYTEAAWRHMDLLLRPGGEMLHAVDLSFPSNRGVWKVLGAVLFDTLYPLLPHNLRVDRCKATPAAYIRLALRTLGIRPSIPRSLSVLNMVLNPEVLSEEYSYGLNRMLKDGMKDYHYQRAGTLLLHLRKNS